MYLILLSVKQGGIKYHFKSLWYDAKITVPILGDPREEASHLPRSCDDGILNIHVRKLQQKMRNIIPRSVSALSVYLSPHDALFIFI